MGFEIKDSGIGMTEEQVARIFDPFTQAEAGTTRKFGGTGLGLSIAKKILDAMGGIIKVESNPGIGSKFSFELTFDAVDAKDDGFVKKIRFDELKKPAFTGEVLLCEDNIMNQQVIKEHLTRVGLKITIAENGSLGVDLIKERLQDIKEGLAEKQFDLILMDIHMPVMDGIEATTEILKQDPKIPIVALTANIMEGDRELYKTSGMIDYLGKPFTSQELWRCLMKYFTPLDWKPEDNEDRLEGDFELRQKLTRKFILTNRNIYNEINDAIISGDIKTAYRLVHTLKSNAGQLGKVILQHAAGEVEESLKNEKNQTSNDQMEKLKNELNTVLTELIPLVQKSPDKIDKIPDDIEIQVLFDDLEFLLNDDNSDCLKLTGDLLKIPGTEELVKQIEDFEFKKALETLIELKEK